MTVFRFVWVFIDDSGDPGFKFEKGSTTHLVMAACVFRERAHIERTMELIEGSRFQFRPNGESVSSCREYKYSKTATGYKARFFEAIQPGTFDVRAIVLDKRVLRSEHLRANPKNLKSYLIRQMLTHHYGQIRGADLIIDGQDTRAFGASDHDYFMRMINREAPGTLTRVQFVDSQKSALIQLADMVAGSLRKSLEGCAESRGYFESYRERTHQPHGSVWHFR